MNNFPDNNDIEKIIADLKNRVNAFENQLALLELQARGWKWGSGKSSGGLVRAMKLVDKVDHLYMTGSMLEIIYIK